jgi:hypothetical protein
MATEAARLDGQKIHIRKNKTVLTHTGLLMEGTKPTDSPCLVRIGAVIIWISGHNGMCRNSGRTAPQCRRSP